MTLINLLGFSALILFYQLKIAKGQQQILNCDLNKAQDGSNWCGFQNSNYTKDLRWSVVEDEVMGWCFAVSDLDKYPGMRARLESIEVSLSQNKDACVSFHYHIDGEGTALLHVIAETFNMSSFSYKHWYIRSPAPTKTWRRHYINLSANTHIDTTVKLLFDVTSKRRIQDGMGGSVKIAKIEITRDGRVASICSEHGGTDQSCPSAVHEPLGTSKASKAVNFLKPIPSTISPTTKQQQTTAGYQLTINAKQASIKPPPPQPVGTTPQPKTDVKIVGESDDDLKSKINVDIGANKPEDLKEVEIEANIKPQEKRTLQKQSAGQVNIDVSLG